MTDQVCETRATYDVIADEYAGRWSHPGDWLTAEVDHLLTVLPPAARVADVGCGPGHHTRLLRERGLRAVGLDLSWGMLRAQLVTGVAQADMRAIPLAASSLDAIWCVAALLHIPRPDIPGVLTEFARVLRPRGQLVAILAEGEGERWEPVSYESGRRRWYVMHRMEALAGQLSAAGFEISAWSRRSTHRDWLQLRARRR